MYKFVIQCQDLNSNLIPLYDFGFSLIKAIDYNNWYHGEKDYEIVLTEKLEEEHTDCIPVGSVEFVSEHMKKFHNIQNVKPINIPLELTQYAGRTIVRGNKNEVKKLFDTYKEIFVKSDDKIKGFSEICTNQTLLPDGCLFASNMIDIQAEYRCFVKDKKLLDIRRYSGEFCFPDIQKIEEMISLYNNCPPAYTLDVAVTEENQTITIEVHNFFSCGLYGFADYSKLPKMLIRAYNWQLKQ